MLRGELWVFQRSLNMTFDRNSLMSTRIESTSTISPDDYPQEIIELAQEALQQCRATLMLAYRFLDAALWRMPLIPAPVLEPISTDGKTLWFNPVLTLVSFRDNPNELTRDLLHCILHCILRQPFDKSHENARAWWLACDIAVEAIVMEMAGDALPSDLDAHRNVALSQAHEIQGVITPQRLYEVFDAPMRRAMLLGPDEKDPFEDLEKLFIRDGHSHWPQFFDDADNPDKSDVPRKEQSNDPSQSKQNESDDHSENPFDTSGSAKGEAQGERNEPSEQDGFSNDPDHNQSSNNDGESSSSQNDDDDGSGGISSGDGLEEESSNQSNPPDDPDDGLDDGFMQKQLADAEVDWTDISKRMQEELETYSKKFGNTAGQLLANVRVANRKPIDYADFLRRFATRREDMKINDDEFDYVFYTLGMDMYGDMPLIEPLEYQETERVREFVVAIDTSGSCAGNLVQNFIDRTFQILSETRESDGPVNMHIVQCDADIRQDTKITSLDELERLTQNFQVKGFGGTDFRPVFQYVDELINEGEFEDLRGVIYFTDGFGIFPKVPPDYDTAFVFIEDEGQARNVPPWAMKVVLKNEQLKTL